MCACNVCSFVSSFHASAVVSPPGYLVFSLPSSPAGPLLAPSLPPSRPYPRSLFSFSRFLFVRSFPFFSFFSLFLLFRSHRPSSRTLIRAPENILRTFSRTSRARAIERGQQEERAGVNKIRLMVLHTGCF